LPAGDGPPGDVDRGDWDAKPGRATLASEPIAQAYLVQFVAGEWGAAAGASPPTGSRSWRSVRPGPSDATAIEVTGICMVEPFQSLVAVPRRVRFGSHLLHRRPPVMRTGTPLRELAAPAGCRRGFPVRDVHGMDGSRWSFAPKQTTRDADLQGFYGSDGTRTRDLRRDRPNQVRRRASRNGLTCRCFLPLRHLRSAWLSQSSDRRSGHEWATKSCLLGQRA
jgi:hypothetical protein